MAKRLTTKQFIEKARAVHGDRYDYSNVEYVNNRTKVVITCPEHGPFQQKPNSHIDSKQGCPDCGGTKALTTKTFIEKAIAVHSNRYDYSQVEYVNMSTKVIIVCLEHGPFSQFPRGHLSKQGCPECAGLKPLTTETFIDKAKTVHGERYDYSQVEYVNGYTKVTIICPEHGLFGQTPKRHTRGSGCPECAGLKPLTTETFIEKAKAAHGDRYDYSRVEYVNAYTKVAIICPEHGLFSQKPSSHLFRTGCPECGGSKPLTVETFIEKAKAAHGDRYDYSRVEYVNTKTNVTIICPQHGPFPQTPSAHLMKQGCPECGGTKQRTNETFIEMAKGVHGERYDYSLVEYVNADTKVTIICTEHGPFLQTPLSHIHHESGCPDCAETGFNPSDRGIVYYIAIETDDGDTRYKIGITNTTVAKRFPAPDLARIRIVKTWQYAVGREAAEHEARVLKQYVGDKYQGPAILTGPGNSELFTHDILGLDK